MSSREPLVYSLQEEALGGFEPIIDIGDRWMELPHADSRSRGFILVPGEEVTTPGFLVDPARSFLGGRAPREMRRRNRGG